MRGSTIAVVMVLGAVVLGYEASVRGLIDQWGRDPNYSHGFFVAPIALAIAWARRGAVDSSRCRPSWWGLLLLAGVLALRVPLFQWNEQYLESATIPLAVAAVTLALGGTHLLRVMFPAVLFLVFLLPLPPSVNTLLARPLQNMATAGSVTLLQLIGLPAMAEGNVIVVGDVPLEVARACNGLSMLLSFVTLITATVLLIQRPIAEKVLLLLSAVPIAIVSNVVRITLTALAYRWLGPETGERYAHDYAGWAMMPLALGLVWAELALFSRLFVEVREVDPAALIRARTGTGAGTGKAAVG
jgi:exosortase